MKWLCVIAMLGACTRPSEDRAYEELGVGIAEIADAKVTVAGGLAAVRELADHRLVVWSNSPVLDIELVVGSGAGGDWTITAMNSLADARLVADGVTIARTGTETGPTVATFVVPLAPGTHALRVAPPDADTPGAFRVAAMADIQTALPSVDQVFREINGVADVRFVVAMGDITQRAEEWEYEMFDRQLRYLRIPFYTTLGNHELWAPASRYFERFGRASFQFTYRGVSFTFVDSGDAAIDPLVDEQLRGWLADARDRPNVFLTHMPPVDPSGLRYGSFRSTRDGQRLLAELVEGKVDLTLYGHIHTYEAYENGGIPAHISGGGGAEPMKLDGIDRHFLMVELDATVEYKADAATSGVRGVELHRVD
ncbi:MAG: metallophosphoesterase [Myxococcales bacterium]|nr:metallophosphoesterase [Myxococcales bacterium]